MLGRFTRIMNIWHTPLTDARSVRIRLLLSLAWSFPLLFGIWLWHHSFALVMLLAVAMCYMSAVQFFLDRWRLRNPNAPLATERWIRGVAASVAILWVIVGAIVIQ